MKKSSIKNGLTTIAIFMMCFYSFNTSIIDAIFPNALKYFLIFFSLFLIIATSLKDVLKECRSRKALLIITVALISVILIRNGDIQNGIYWNPALMCSVILSVYFLSFRKDWHKKALLIISLFTIEHILATIYCALNKDFYLSNIWPLFKDSNGSMLLRQLGKDQIAGITGHYSTNALYLITGMIVNSMMVIMDDKKNKRLRMIKLIILLLNSIAILLTGKRAQVVFFIIALALVTILKNRKNILTLLKRTAIIGVTGIVMIVMLSCSIPSITNSFTRAFDALSDTSVMDTRNVLYDFAFEQYQNHELFGIGWGNYKHQYYFYAPQKEMDYMQTHCIYLQLLCETGIIGFIFFMAIFIKLLMMAIKDAIKDGSHYAYLFLLFHIYFLLEGILGNSIYDVQIYLPYSLILALYLNYHFSMKQQQKKALYE